MRCHVARCRRRYSGVFDWDRTLYPSPSDMMDWLEARGLWPVQTKPVSRSAQRALFIAIGQSLVTLSPR